MRKSLKQIGLSALVAVVSAPICFSQDAPPPIPQEGVIVTAVQDGADAPRVMSFSTISGDAAAPMMLMASSPGLSFGTPNTGAMLFDQQIQSELELVDDQLDQLRDIQREMNESMQSQMAEMRSEDGNFQFNSEWRDTIREIQEHAQEQYEEVLLPHQVDRLKQIRFHLQMRNQGEVETLQDALDLTDEEAEELQERAERIQKELDEEIRRLRMEAKEELFDGLTREQQEKLKDLTGDTFVYEQQDISRQMRERRRSQSARQENQDDD